MVQTTLRPVAAAFVAFGLFWGSWAVAAIDVERSLGLSHAALGLLLAVSLVASVIVNVTFGSVVERWGTSIALSRSLVIWALLIGGAAVTVPRLALFAPVFALSVGAAGAVDVAMNVAATAALGSQPGRLVRFHALFNVGAAGGALVTGALLRAGISFRWVWVGIGILALALSADAARAALPAGGPGEPHSLLAGLRLLWRERLLGLAGVFACGALVEGGIDTWGVLFLRDSLGIGVLAGTSAYVIGQSLAAGTRSVLGAFLAGGAPSAPLRPSPMATPPRTRAESPPPPSGRPIGATGGVRGAQVGAALAMAGLTVEALSPWGWAAALGLALAAMGISTCWPLLLASAGQGSQRPGMLVGGLTGAGYLGFVVGPPLVGWVAGVWHLQAGLLLLAVAAFAVAVLAGPLLSAARPGSELPGRPDARRRR